MSGRRLRTRKQLTPPPPSPPIASTRPRRGTVGRPAPPTTIERSSPDESRTSSIRLTVKADPKKLKEATSGPTTKGRGKDSFEGGEIVRGARSTRKKAIIESEPEDEEEEEDEEEAEVEVEVEEEEEVDEDEEDADGSDEDEAEEEDDEEEDADGSADEEMVDGDEDEEDAEGSDEEMEDAPPVVPKGKLSITKPQVTITPAKPLLSVEEKEMAMDEDDDEELSSLDEDEELEGELGTGVDEMSDDDMDGSRSATPDLSKLTRRQRAEAAGLMALSNGTFLIHFCCSIPKRFWRMMLTYPIEAQKKKHLTADEISLRRAEMARRRKALSEKRNDEEKQDTINRLLKRQASKRQRKADVEADRIAEEGEDYEGVRPSKVYARYVQNTKGVMLGVPREWVHAGYVGGVFGKESGKGGGGWTGRMVEVVE
jgi:Ino eighty subunit 2